jgi:hypothetical protein
LKPTIFSMPSLRCVAQRTCVRPNRRQYTYNCARGAHATPRTGSGKWTPCTVSAGMHGGVVRDVRVVPELDAL